MAPLNPRKPRFGAPRRGDDRPFTPRECLLLIALNLACLGLLALSCRLLFA